MSQVGDSLQSLGHLGFEPAEPLLLFRHLRLEALALLDERGPLCRVLLPARGLGHLVLTAADLLDGLEQSPAFSLKRDHAIDILDHVERDIAVAAVLFDRLGVRDDEFEIKHRNTLLI